MKRDVLALPCFVCSLEITWGHYCSFYFFCLTCASSMSSFLARLDTQQPYLVFTQKVFVENG